METHIPDKNSVETIPLGHVGISLINVSDFWIDQEKVEHIRNSIAEVWKAISAKELAPLCEITRQIIVSGDFSSEVYRWQRLLGEAESVSTDSIGTTMGKNITWGNGETNNTFAVIVLHEDIGIGLVSEQQKNWQERCKSLLAHELAHTHDNFECLKIFGKETPVMLGDWPRIRHSLARQLWGEYFAESIAFTYNHAANIDSDTQLAIDLAKQCQQTIESEILQHKNTPNIDNLWKHSTSEIAKTLNQIGRASGILGVASLNDPLISKKLIEGIIEVSPLWGQTVRNMFEEMQRMKPILEWTPQRFNSLEQLVEKFFHDIGFYPTYNQQRLFLNIT